MTQLQIYFKINAFREEFPFLDYITVPTGAKTTETLNWDFCTNIKVKRVTKEILMNNTFTETVYYDEDFGYSYEVKNLFYFQVYDVKGNKILPVPHVKLHPEFEERGIRQESTPLEFLTKEYMKDKTLKGFSHLVQYETGFAPPDVDDCEKFFKLRIYKPAKNENFVDMLSEEMEKARARVRAEARF